MDITNIDGNEVIGKATESGICKVQFNGTGNKLVIGSSVRLTGVAIVFGGSNSVIEFGDGSRLRGTFVADDGCNIKIGQRTKFNKPCRLHAAEACNIAVGNDCLFANVRFRTSDSHSIIDLGTGQRINAASDIVIGNKVWAAENVYIYKGVTVGSGSVIGAGAIVVKSIPENCLAAGIPAKTLKTNISWDEKRI